MNNKQEWPDEILREIIEGKVNEKPEITSKKPIENSDGKSIPLMMRYGIKLHNVERYLMDLFCQGYTEDEIEKLMANRNYETQPILEDDFITKLVDGHRRRYEHLYPPSEAHKESILFKSQVADWATIAWNQLIDNLELLGDTRTDFIEVMEEHMSTVDDAKRLQDTLCGYFLIVNHKAPDYVIHAVFESIVEATGYFSDISEEQFDYDGFTLRQAIAIDEFVDFLCEDQLLFIDTFRVQNTKSIRIISYIFKLLSMVLYPLEGEENDR